MLNPAIGVEQCIDGKTCILTNRGARGCAISGSHSWLEAGRYCVIFDIVSREGLDGAENTVCAKVDVVTNSGRTLRRRPETGELGLGFFTCTGCLGDSCLRDRRLYRGDDR